MRARCEATLVKCHQETNGTRPWVVTVGRSTVRLRFYERCDFAVEFVFSTVDVEVHGGGDTLGENLLGFPSPVWHPLREIDHRLFCASKVERGTAAFHRLPNRLHIGIGVFIEELEKETEVRRVALVWSGR